MSKTAYIWSDPGRMGGTPCVGGTRIPTHQVARAFREGFGNEYVGSDYGLTERQCLVACWFEAEHGFDAELVRYWNRWALLAHERLRRDDRELPPWPPVAKQTNNQSTKGPIK